MNSYYEPLLLSFEIALISVFFAAIVGIILAIVLCRVKFWGRELLDVLFTLPLVLPPTVLGYYLLVVIGNRSILGRFWIKCFGDSLVFTRKAAITAAFVSVVPLIIRSARTAFEEVSIEVENAARLLGASELRVFFTITLPLSWRGVAAGCTLAFARALGDFGATLMVAGNLPGKTQTAALAIYDAISAGRDSDALWLSGILSILSMILLYGFNHLMKVSMHK